ncbi:MAG: hypothetical protein OXE96_14600 [Gemmatimonadetes bacterium]|nr:hypothetical protein [Gemmatimonadota bacterium]
MKERVRLLGAAGRNDWRVGSRVVEPGEGEGVEFGAGLGEAME